MSETLESVIREWVVNHYFTPNIKAEVIFDTLITPCIEEIVKEQLGEAGEGLVFLTKEMSIMDEVGVDNKVSKVDYVLADQNRVYLVELKTTDSSINDEQADAYREICQDKGFGEILGCRLLSILSGGGRTFTLHLGDPSLWGDETLKLAFDEIIGKNKYQADTQGITCAEKAAALIQAQNWTQRDRYRSRKYLYTLGQLVDYLDGGETLWNKPMTVLYLTPDGNAPDGFKGLSLKRFTGNGSFYAKFLSDIFEKIYGKENGNV